MLNILMFHEIVTGNPMSHCDVSTRIFSQCLDSIKQSKKKVVTLDQLITPGLNDAIINISFDDGCESDLKVALPILLKEGMKATFFIISGNRGSTGYLSWQEVRELSAAGMEVGSHTHTHPFITRLSIQDAKNELVRSKEALEQCLGKEVTSLSFPNGDYNKQILELAQEVGYKNICSSKPGLNSLPLKEKVILKRNALHRFVLDSDLESFISPTKYRQLIRQVNYESRKLIKNVITPKVYKSLRDRIMDWVKI